MQGFNLSGLIKTKTFWLGTLAVLTAAVTAAFSDDGSLVPSVGEFVSRLIHNPALFTGAVAVSIRDALLRGGQSGQ